MKNFKFILLICAGFLITFTAAVVKAQDETPAGNETKQTLKQARRPNLLAELGLTKDQIQQIRRINTEKKPLMRDAQQKVREANRSLDQAIYADTADETEIQARLKDVQVAQAEVLKIRSITELAVRKVLNPEQLVKFREVRQRFMEQRIEETPRRRRNRPLNAPNQRLINRQRKLNSND